VPLRAGQSAASRQAVLNSISFLGGINAQNPVFRSLRNDLVNGVPIQTGLTNNGIVQPIRINNHTVRFDHKLRDDDNLTFRYIFNSPFNVNNQSNLGFGALFAGNTVIKDNNFALSETHIFNQNLLNEFRFRISGAT
jgi:hypothetical protein